MAHQERKRRLALGKAYIFEPGPLIAAGRHEHERSENIARACHRGIEQSSTLKCPLHQGGEQGEGGPSKEIADDEQDRCSEWRALRPGLPAHTGNMRIIGAAEGVIMPTIITIHM